MIAHEDGHGYRRDLSTGVPLIVAHLWAGPCDGDAVTVPANQAVVQMIDPQSRRTRAAGEHPGGADIVTVTYIRTHATGPRCARYAHARPA